MGESLYRSICPKFEEVIIMNEAAIGLTITSLGVLMVFIGFLIWGIRTGQFTDVEEAKYQMLEDVKVGSEVKTDA